MSAAEARADVVVVGAGVIGTAIAYLLAKEGLEVCILEKESVGRGATGHGHGVISLVGRDFRPGPHFRLGVASAAMYGEFAEQVLEDGGVDPLYHVLDGISLALIEEEERIFRDFLAREEARELLDLRWSGVEEIRALEPRITEQAIGGVLHRHGQVDGYRLALGALAAVERLGGRLVIGEANGLILSGERAVGVTHTHGAIACGHVVVASGAWIGAGMPWLGRRVPVRPLHGEVLHVELPGDPVRVFILTARHGPILPRRDGLLMVGSIGGVTMSGMDVDAKHVFDPNDATPVEFDEAPRQESLEFMIQQAVRVMPAIAEATLVAHLAGVRPLAADRMPLIGELSGREGVILAAGHGTKGIHLAPVTARAVADLIVHGASDPRFELDAFKPDRFLEAA